MLQDPVSPGSTARLTNRGSPFLSDPPSPPVADAHEPIQIPSPQVVTWFGPMHTPTPPATATWEPRPPSPRDDYHAKPPKHDFPKSTARPQGFGWTGVWSILSSTKFHSTIGWCRRHCTWRGMHRYGSERSSRHTKGSIGTSVRRWWKSLNSRCIGFFSFLRQNCQRVSIRDIHVPSSVHGCFFEPKIPNYIVSPGAQR